MCVLSPVCAAVDALVVLEGFRSDALNLALLQHWGEPGRLHRAAIGWSLPLHNPIAMALHAPDAEDKPTAQPPAYSPHPRCRVHPVALAATDRAPIRRVLAHLDSQGVLVRDESGWILSTTRSAKADGALEAAAWNASSNAVLDWLKHARAAGLPTPTVWSNGCAAACCSSGAPPPQRRDFSAQPPWPAPWPRWRLADTLHAPHGPCRSGCWRCAPVLEQAGQWQACRPTRQACVLAALRLQRRPASRAAAGAIAGRRMTPWRSSPLGEGCAGGRALRGTQAGEAPVVVLPIAPIAGRSFAAAVLPGSDENACRPRPEPTGRLVRPARGLGFAHTPVAGGCPARRLANALRARGRCAVAHQGRRRGAPAASALVLALL